MKKLLFLLYSVICYCIFLVIFLYLIGFVENISRFPFATDLIPLFAKTLDFGQTGTPVLPAILIDLLLIAIFGIQHSVMARIGFKQRWTAIVPAPIERSTYVLFASIGLITLYYFWQPIIISVWDLRSSLIGSIFFGISLAGWGMLLISTFLINHFDLFGLRQTYLHALNKQAAKPIFKSPLFYKMVRHPIYLSFLVAFWFAPLMTVGHLVFNIGMTVYIFIGISHEERDLDKIYKEQYSNYRERVPKIIPFTK